MIKIISGWTNTGGSTVALINLTNALNNRGYDTIMLGPHQWHLDKCRSGLVGRNMRFNPDDQLIFHFISLKSRPNAKRVILTCHEKWWFDVGSKFQYWDDAVFLHQQHRDYHVGYKGSYHIIPNIREPFIKRNKVDMGKVAGVIGTIEDRKQTHVSIQRALKDDCEKIYLFGNIGDVSYYNQFVKDLIDNNKVIHYGFEQDKQKIYDMVERVYHSSKGEVACLIKDECYATGTKFLGNEETTHDVCTLDNDEIINRWISVLNI